MRIEGLIRVDLSPEELGLDNAVTDLRSYCSQRSGPAGTSPQGGARLAAQVEMVKDRVRESLVRSFTTAAIVKMVAYTEGATLRFMALVETEASLSSELVNVPFD